MTAVEYASADGRFVVVLQPDIMRRLVAFCAASPNLETGGILIGRYAASLRVAVVTGLSGPPAGSRGSSSTFFRAIGHLQRWLDELWSSRGGYYLGEWHAHPGGSAEPSGIDVHQLSAIANDPGYCCPEPILVVLGGESAVHRTLSVTIFVRGGASVRLHEVRGASTGRATE
ncbi:MAG TPA: Mov34/MPN/PAD-1 family protein [Polyangia bacterium]